MKLQKLVFGAFAILISSVTFAQKKPIESTGKVYTNEQTHSSVNKTQKRANGSLSANAHASERAQQRAAGNSVLFGTTTTNSKNHKTVKRKTGKKKTGA
ncbi:MAG TPA: hypothetical protein VM871_11525 [Flavisolibacter sp.]|nr:hypothetical protein [Flavisolibacter sp.]